MNIKVGDKVALMTGDKKDKYENGTNGKRKTAKVVGVDPKEGKVIIEGVNMVTKHVKPKQQGELGGRVQAESPVYACKVQLVCPKCDKPTRAGHKIEDGKKIRVCKKCGAELKY